MRYSPSTKAFFAEDIIYSSLPDDLIEIADDDHAALFAAQAAGLTIVPSPDGSPIAVVQVPEVTTQQVDAERDRRIAAGCTVALSPDLQVRVQGRPIDRENLHGLATVAALMGGQSTGTVPFRDADNVIHALSAEQVVALFAGAAGYVTAVYQAAWAIKDAPTIPTDFIEDGHWPDPTNFTVA